MITFWDLLSIPFHFGWILVTARLFLASSRLNSHLDAGVGGFQVAGLILLIDVLKTLIYGWLVVLAIFWTLFFLIPDAQGFLFFSARAAGSILVLVAIGAAIHFSRRNRRVLLEEAELQEALDT